MIVIGGVKAVNNSHGLFVFLDDTDGEVGVHSVQLLRLISKPFVEMLGKMRTIGSKAEVFHGTAKRTSGGLKKENLMKTSKGRIVSRKKHAAGKKAIQRLFKAGYKPTKGTFTAMRKGVRTTRRKGMRGGYAPPAPPTASAQTPQQAAQALQGMMKALTGK